jgi:hypothetical protein
MSELLDRNKTGITHEVTLAASQWLNAKGFKPVETEVPVEEGWVADLAGVIVPTQTELIDLKLLKRPPSWNERHSLITKRRIWDADTYAVWRKELEALSRTMTCLVEVKTSRADFRGDRKWTSTIPTDLAFLAVPKGLVTSEEWPAGWGILEYEDGSITRRRAPALATVATEQQLGVVLSIAIRRDHHTRYARWREYQREERIEAGERKTIKRITQCMNAVLHIVEGKHPDVATTLEWHQIKDLQEHQLNLLQRLHGISAAVKE